MRRERRYVANSYLSGDVRECSINITLNHYDNFLNSIFCRLLQNRKSAKKCRLKKKAELKNMLGDVSGM